MKLEFSRPLSEKEQAALRKGLREGNFAHKHAARRREAKTMKQAIVCHLMLMPQPPDLPSDLRYAEVALPGFDPEPVVVGNHYEDGIIGVYIPPGAIIPDKIAEEMWLKGRLAGKKKNVVKARTFFGTYSNGLFYGSRYFTEECGRRVFHDGPSWNKDWELGRDVSQEFGITFKDE